jgi:hypothetical protein
MANLKRNFLSLVALGRPNPQILTVDFLKVNKIISTDEPPFDKLFQQEKAVKKFLSVPGFTNLVLGNIEFIVDETRFQIREDGISGWTETKIIDIAKKYFEVLRYTPLNLVGINLNSIITFDTSEEAHNCQKLCLPEDSQLARIISNDNIIASSVLRYPFSDGEGRITLIIEQPDKENKKRVVNFNYEFDFIDWTRFKSELEKVPEIGAYSDSILDRLLGAI